MRTELGNMCFNSPKSAYKRFMGEPYGAGNKPQEKEKKNSLESIKYR
jgi:hypothetical protein